MSQKLAEERTIEIPLLKKMFEIGTRLGGCPGAVHDTRWYGPLVDPTSAKFRDDL